MNDHNLDDLIIDTSSHKGGKAKDLLTIIALLIVVLIVAIILTKIILKDPGSDQSALADNDTEMISTELTLQNDNTDNDTNDQEALSDMFDHTDVPKPDRPTPQSAAIPKSTPAPKSMPDTPVKPKTSTEKEIVKKIPHTASLTKPVAKKTAHKQPIPTTTPRGNFYIQVGSFSQTLDSSSRLLSAIKKQGYHYKIITSNGMKKVLVGPYATRNAVDKAIIRVRNLINKSAFVVKK